MYFRKESCTWIQCQSCGMIYSIDEDVAHDKLYIMSYCPRCDDCTTGLNCGDSKDDIYLYTNANVDPRCYEY